MYPFILYYKTLKPETLEELSLTEFRWSWHWISKYQVLSELFIEKYSDKVDWGHVSCHQILSESFIQKHIQRLPLALIVLQQKHLSEKFKSSLVQVIYKRNNQPPS